MTARGIRTKIIGSYCALMLVGGTIMVAVVRHVAYDALVTSKEQRAQMLAELLARQLAGPVDDEDWRSVGVIVEAEGEHNAWVELVLADGLVHRGGTLAVPSGLRDAGRASPVIVRSGSTDVVDVIATLPGRSGAAVHVGVSLEPAREASLDVIRTVAASTIAAMLAGALAIWLVATLLTGRLRRLTVAARRTGRGEAVQVVLGGSDEVAELARGFDEMAREVRARIEQSEQLRAYFEGVLDEMPSAVLVCQEDGAIAYLNRAARGLLGAEAEKLPTALRESITRVAGRDAGASGPSAETGSWTSPQGRAFDLAVVPMRGAEKLAIATLTDVTENRELADRLGKAERLAIAGELAAGVVHAINNPLDGVRRAISLAARNVTDAERLAEMLQIAKEGTDRIATVTQGLLRYARARGGKDGPGVTTPAAIVEEAVRLVMLRAEEQHVKLRLDLAADLPEIAVDVRSMVELVVNLLVNAVDAAGPGGRVIASARGAPGGWIELAVEDDGPGIDPELGERVFEPFFTTKPPGLGTGLGLSVARRVAEAHGGEIILRTRAEQGPVGKQRGAELVVRLPPDVARAVGAPASAGPTEERE